MVQVRSAVGMETETVKSVTAVWYGHCICVCAVLDLKYF